MARALAFPHARLIAVGIIAITCPAAASDVERIYGEGDTVGGLNAFLIDGLSVAPGGGYATRLKSGPEGTNVTTEAYVGSVSGGAPAVLVGEGTFNIGGSTYNRNELFATVQLNDAGQLAHSGQTTRNGSIDIDIIWVGDTLVFEEGESISAIPGATFTGGSALGITAAGVPQFEARYSGGEALFSGKSNVLIKSGDAIGADTVAGDGALSNASFSDNAYITRVQGTIGGLASEYLVRNGTILAREADLIGTGNGGGLAETYNSFDRASTNDAGDWLVSAFTNAASTSETVVALNGTVVAREGTAVPTIDGGTFVIQPSGSVGIALNAEGDWAAAYDNAVLFNGIVVAYEGMTTIDGGPTLLSDVQTEIGLSDRYGDGLVDLLFIGRQGGGTADTLYRITLDANLVPEPGTLALAAICGLAVLRRRRA
jgi:hypothetical protein